MKSLKRIVRKVWREDVDMKRLVGLSVRRLKGKSRDILGELHYKHNEKVANMLESDEEKALGVLHDTVWDKRSWIWCMRKYGVLYADMCMFMQRGEQEGTREYAERLGRIPMIGRVALADAWCEAERLREAGTLSESGIAKLREWEEVISILKDMLRGESVESDLLILRCGE